MKKVAILQSNYIPWKGYFDIINMVDEFIIYDDAQYTRRDWRNRNKIITPNGVQWLTIPVETKGKYFQKIKDTVISNSDWGQKHWSTIIHNYSKAKYFQGFKDTFEELFLGSKEKYLSEINYKYIDAINSLLGVTTKITQSMDYNNLAEGNTEKLVNLCKLANAKIYLSGPAAKNYLDEELFTREGIKVEWMNYSGYPEYKQQQVPFVHGVSIIDLIFNEGDNAREYIKSFSESSK